MIEDTVSEAEARRFYDRHGAQLEWADLFEARAKALAFAWADVQPGQAVLELGVGTGRFLAHAQARGAGLLVGVDLSPVMLRLARAQAPAAHLVRASAARLPLPEARFDRVFSAYLLDLLPRPTLEATLLQLRRALRPEGRAVLCSLTEGRSSLEQLFMSLWGAIVRVAPARVGGCRPLPLAALAEAAGLSVLRREHVGQRGMPSEVVLVARGD